VAGNDRTGLIDREPVGWGEFPTSGNDVSLIIESRESLQQRSRKLILQPFDRLFPFFVGYKCVSVFEELE
jgi:hypothetical protein